MSKIVFYKFPFLQQYTNRDSQEYESLYFAVHPVTTTVFLHSCPALIPTFWWNNKFETSCTSLFGPPCMRTSGIVHLAWTPNLQTVGRFKHCVTEMWCCQLKLVKISIGDRTNLRNPVDQFGSPCMRTSWTLGLNTWHLQNIAQCVLILHRSWEYAVSRLWRHCTELGEQNTC